MEITGLDEGKMAADMKEALVQFEDKKKQIPAEKATSKDRGVIYLGRIPHGFYEKQMKGYFSQFGDIKKLRLVRNRHTGKSKHFGFIEFKVPEVAPIVADTMHNYLLSGHLLQCKVLTPEQIHPKLFNAKKVKVENMGIKQAKLLNKPRSAAEIKKLQKKQMAALQKKEKTIKNFGIDYTFLN
ncbi:hypothetical protein BDB01DRAFT_779170 [Pilobolus umbonatus]|nr:hypothetical protein BDB01DRAFT_779170 [Pilobolus umbonatus]